MSNLRAAARIALVCGIVLFGTATVRAQDLQVSPTSWDFGNVLVGNSETVTFDLLGGWPSPVWVYIVLLNETPDDNWPYVSPHFDEWSLGAFSFNSATWPPMPQELPVGDHILIDVIFTPPSPGDFDVYLGILSNDSVDGPGTQGFFRLEGTGVAAAVPEPGTALLALLGLGAIGWRRRRGMQRP